MDVFVCGPGSEAEKRATVQRLADQGQIPCEAFHGDACEGTHDILTYRLWQQAKAETTHPRRRIDRCRELYVSHGLLPATIAGRPTIQP